jgi:hypothetical protein
VLYLDFWEQGDSCILTSKRLSLYYFAGIALLSEEFRFYEAEHSGWIATR